jgi:pilus assembly protein CpaB
MRRLTPAGVSGMMVVAVGLLVTAYFAKLMRAEEPRNQPIGTYAHPTATGADLRTVPTAAGTLEPGTVITPAHLGTGRVPAELLGPDALLEERTLIGRAVKERVTSGSVIRASQLYPPGERPQQNVARGMRALSIALKRAVAPINGLEKGQYVDVYLTPRSDASKEVRRRGGMTLTLFRGVRLLAVNLGQAASEPQDVATLELTPEQANVLILARERGNVALSYNPEGKGDGGIALENRDRATLDEILGLTPDPSAVAGPAGTFTTEVYKGSARSTQQFDERTKIDASRATSTPIPPFQVAPQTIPLWTRKGPATAPQLPPPERLSILPDQQILR